MNQLNEIQHQFWNSLRNHNTDPTCTQLFSTSGKLTQQERLNIYRDTMRTAHTNALAQTYKCCEKILGKRYFNQIAKQYFYKHPATDQNLSLYGQSLPNFLQEYVNDHAELSDYQYLPDLARLELAYEQAYYANEDPLFDFSSLATVSDYSHQNLCFETSASLAVLRSDYPIYEIWLANLEQEHAQEINAIHEPQYLCLVREDVKPIIYKIDLIYWWVLEKIKNNSSFAELDVLATREEIDIPLQKIIPELIQKKWICGFNLAPDKN